MKKLTVILVLMVCGIIASAQESFHKELFSVDVVLKYRIDLGLTAPQIERVKQIYTDHITVFNSAKWDLDAELVALNKYLSPAVVDEKAALVQMEKVLKLEDELKKMKLGMLIKVKNELKVTQQEKLKNLRTENDMEEVSEVKVVNENPRISVRYDGTFSDNKPLYIVNDKKGERRVKSIADIRGEDIQSINVIKKESAEQVYGGEGKNGVVIINLKN
jgi:pyruvate/2-oxoacid:ferredoxin oxidoreductase alpha subunit